MRAVAGGFGRVLPSGRTGWFLAGTALTDAAGTGFFIAGSAVFFNVYLGIPASHIGLGMSIAGGVGLISTLTCGRLVDRVGARRMFVVMTLAQACLFLCYPIVDGGLSFFLLLAAMGALEYGSAPAWGTLVAKSVPASDRVATRAYLRAVYNAGFSLGSLASAAVVVLGTPTAFLSLVVVNAFSFALCAVFAGSVEFAPTHADSEVEAVNDVPSGVGEAAPKFRTGRAGSAIRNFPFVGVTAASAILAMHVSILLIAVPLWIVDGGKGPAWLVGWILALNTVLTVALQVQLSKSSSTLNGAANAARRSGLLLAGACLLLALSGFVGVFTFVVLLLLAAVVLTFAELLQSASAWGITYAVAPEHRIGDYQGVFGMSQSAQAMIGPGLVVYLGVEHGPYGWLVIAAPLLLAACIVKFAAKRAALHAGAYTEPDHMRDRAGQALAPDVDPTSVLVVIGAGAEAMREPILRRAAAVAPLWLLSEYDSNWYEGLVRGKSALDLTDDDAVRAAVDAIPWPLAGVITFIEEHVEITAQIAMEHQLPGMTIDSVRACRDKDQTRKRMAAAAQPGPLSTLVDSPDLAVFAAERIGYPVVLKPANLGGSLGVRKAINSVDVLEAYVAAAAAVADGVPRYEAGVLVEEYLRGPEISVDSAVVAGELTPMVIARKITGPEPWFEETGHDFVPDDKLFHDNELLSALVAAHKALGISSGVTHSEWRLTQEGPRLIEVNARLGGQLIPHAGSGQGFDPVRVACEIALGVIPNLSRAASGEATANSIRFFYPDHDIRVERLGVVGHIPAEVVSYGFMASPGDELRLPPSGYQSKYAYVHVAAQSLEECTTALAIFETSLNLEAQPLLSDA